MPQDRELPPAPGDDTPPAGPPEELGLHGDLQEAVPCGRRRDGLEEGWSRLHGPRRARRTPARRYRHGNRAWYVLSTNTVHGMLNPATSELSGN